MLPASSLSSPLSTPSPSPRRPHTPLSRVKTPAPLILVPNGGPQLPELGLKIPVRSPTPRSTKVSLWIDRLPRRAPHDVEREVRRVFEAGGGGSLTGSVRRTAGSRTRSLGTIDGLCVASSLRRLQAAEKATHSLKPSNKLVWWNLASSVASEVPEAPSPVGTLHSTSVPLSPAPRPRNLAGCSASDFYKRLSRLSSTSTLTPSSSSPSTPSLVYSSGVSSNSSTSFVTAGEIENRRAENDTDEDDDDEERTSHTSTPTPTLSPLSPGFGSSAVPRAMQRPLRVQPPFASLKRRSTTGDLLDRYLDSEYELEDHPNAPAPRVRRPAPSPTPVAVSALAVPRLGYGARVVGGGGGGLPARKKLPWRLNAWRRER